MKQNILLTSEDFLRSKFSISDNIQSKFLLPAVRETQEVKLKAVIGEPLLKKLKALIENDDILKDENTIYRELVDMCQLYIGYMAISELCMMSTFKINNIGVNTTSDENVDVLSFKEVSQVREYYQKKGDSYCLYLQNWLLQHHKDLPELCDAKCYEIQSNLRSSASCNIWLGGARGKGYGNRYYNYDK